MQIGIDRTITQRDSFWNRIYSIASRNKNIVIVSADMGAPSLDKFRKDLPGQFINVGIAEQSAITLAAGLALTGKKVFVYGIASFITLRNLEQMRIALAMMKLPVSIVGIGAGLSYQNSGPTHHLLEDIAVMRAFPNMTIHSITDNIMAVHCAEYSVKSDKPGYIRLERHVFPDIYSSADKFTEGLAVFNPGCRHYILSTGAMTHTALAIAETLRLKGLSCGVIDIYRFPIDRGIFSDSIKKCKKIITLEEHYLNGGLGSAVLETLNDSRIDIPCLRLGIHMKKDYCYSYGSRERLREYFGIDMASIENQICNYIKPGK